jgi:hypothetical protein
MSDSDKYIKSILELLKTPCNNKYLYVRYTNCNQILDFINKIHKKYDKLTMADIDGEISICEKILTYILHDKICYKNCDDNFFYMFSYWIPPDNILDFLFNRIDIKSDFFLILKNLRINPNKSTVSLDKSYFFLFINCYKNYTHGCHIREIPKILDNNFIQTLFYFLEFTDLDSIFKDNFPDELIGIRSSLVYDILVNYMRPGYPITVLEKSCLYVEHMQPIIEYMLQYYEFNQICFKNACQFKDFYYMSNMSNVYKLDPMNYILSKSRILFTREYFQSVFENYDEQKLNILLKNGYEPDVTDIIFMIQKKIELKDISRYNIILDQNVLEECWKYDFYPKKYKFSGINPKLINLEEMCKYNNNHHIIKNYIKKHKLVPDKKCMVNACGIINNHNVISVLLKYGGVIDQECLESYIKVLNNYTLDMIFRNCNKKQEQIQEKEKEQEQDKEKDKEQDIIYLELDDRTSKIKSMNKIYKTPLKYKKLVSGSKIGDTASYIQIRKDYISYLNENNLLKKIGNSTYIDLPDNIRKKLKIDLTKRYIKLEHIDKLIAYYY